MLPPGYEQSCSFSKEMPGLPLLVFCTTRKAVSFLPPTPHSASSPRSPFINSLSSTLIPACGAHSPPPLCLPHHLLPAFFLSQALDVFKALCFQLHPRLSDLIEPVLLPSVPTHTRTYTCALTHTHTHTYTHMYSCLLHALVDPSQGGPQLSRGVCKGDPSAIADPTCCMATPL